MTAYREPPPAVTITAEQAVETLYRRHNLYPPVDQRWVVQMIEGAAEGRLDHQVAQSARLLMDLGFTRDALVRALVDLVSRGALKPPMSRPPEDPVPVFVAPQQDARLTTHLRNPYADQVVESSWDYPPSWQERRENAVAEKIASIGRLFELTLDGYRVSRDHRAVSSPSGFGTIAMLSPTWLAKRWGIRDPYGNGYPKLLAETIRRVRQVYRFHGFGFAATMLDLEKFNRFHMVRAAAEAMQKIEASSPDAPFLVCPGQLGRRWRGSSIARVEWHASYDDLKLDGGWKEFPLPSLAVLFELIHQPFRLMHNGVLAIDCPGDTIDSYWGFMTYSGVSLAFGHDCLHLLDRSRSRPDPVFGSATGLVRF